MAEQFTAAAHQAATTVPTQSASPTAEASPTADASPAGPASLASEASLAGELGGHATGSAGTRSVGTADGHPVTAVVAGTDGRLTATPPARRPLTRVLLKLGGEMFGGGGVGIDPDVVSAVARQIAEVVRSGVQVAVVIGGGNFFRGAQLQQRGMDRSRGDYMGMLGTVMNCLALQDFLEREQHVDTRVQTAITMGQVAEPYIPRRAIRHLEKGRVVIFGAGVGMPYFSTDTTAAQRALEADAQAVLLAKAVDGVYDADPRVVPDATMFTEITHREVLERGLQVADATAFSLCMDNRMPIIVFNLLTEGNIARAVAGEPVGTLVYTPG